MYALEVHGLTKHMGKKVVLDDVSFSVQPGELLAILGPAESGKTTLLRLISGLEVTDQGNIVLNGKDITDVPVAKRRFSMIFQNGYGLSPQMNALENIAIPLEMNFLNKKEVKQQISGITQALGISHLLERKISSLTEGERMYVALARALVKNPSLLLLDELFIHMDTPTRLATRRSLVAIHKAIQLPCIYVTRDQPDAFALADRVVLINEGKIQQIGTRAELVARPATRWVAQWLGFPPINTLTGVLQGTYRAEGTYYRVWAKGFTPLLPMKWTRLLDSLNCKEVTLGIRPESIIPEWDLREKWQPSFYTFKAEIVASEWNQGKTLAQLQLLNTGEKFLAVFDIFHEAIKVGQVMTVAVDPEQFCLFHPQTNQLLHAPVMSSPINWQMNRPKNW